MTISQMLLPEYDQEMAGTRKTLERVPEDKFSYKPHDKSMSLAQLAGHISDMPVWAKMTIDMDVLTIDADYKPYIPQNRQELLEVFDKNVAAGRAAIEGVTDEHLQKTWKLIYAGQEMLSMPRMVVIRSMVMNHLVHHRAQLGVYLRLNNIAVPGVYGPSADETDPGAAASA